jgi:hypothetical protein
MTVRHYTTQAVTASSHRKRSRRSGLEQKLKTVTVRFAGYEGRQVNKKQLFSAMCQWFLVVSSGTFTAEFPPPWHVEEGLEQRKGSCPNRWGMSLTDFSVSR